MGQDSGIGYRETLLYFEHILYDFKTNENSFQQKLPLLFQAMISDTKPEYMHCCREHNIFTVGSVSLTFYEQWNVRHTF